jgi:putative SOS response-associated peptidase YedK
MCGRYPLIDTDNLKERFNVATVPEGVRPNYNTRPTQDMPVITRNSPNSVQIMKWGLIPVWSKVPKMSYNTFNARADSLDKNTWSRPFKQNRCLVPVNGYYEWKHEPGEKKGEAQPYFFKLKDEGLFSLAGIYDCWHDSEGNELYSFSIITTEPNPIAKPIHDRMPAILDRKGEDIWLTKDISTEELMPLLLPFDEEKMTAYPIAFNKTGPLNNNLDNTEPLNSK